MCLPQRIEEQGLVQKRLTTYGQRSSSDSGRGFLVVFHIYILVFIMIFCTK